MINKISKQRINKTQFNDIITKEEVQYFHCHYGNIYVFTDFSSGIKIYGGGRLRGVIPNQKYFIIDVGAGFESDKNIKNIPWEDGADISLSKEFWLDLIKEIREKKKDVLVACLMGHGRTGTTLAILYALMTGVKKDPVKVIRQIYCKNAVETFSQIKYIEKITNISIKEKPKWR
jgi:hypothetical protein